MKLDGTRVCVAGLGVTGPSAVRALLAQGAQVVAVDGRDGDRERALADELRSAGAEVRLGDGDTLPDGVALVVTSPGWRPDAPLLAAAAAREVPVWGDVELAYRLRPPGQEWLGVTGTNGKTTTVQMLASILRAAGHRAVATGNVGFPVLDAVLADPPYDVLAVEVSSFQLHWTSTVEFVSGAVLNIAPDHLDWHGSLEAYAADKALVWRSDWYAVYNADDPIVSALAARIADTQSFSLSPRAGFALVGDQLVDRGIGTDPGEEVVRVPDGGVVLAERSDIPVPGLHNVANALAAAALARCLNSATGGRLAVHPADVRAGLRAFNPGAHRIAHVATVDGVEYVDDSKATNAHAAAASLSAYPSVVWVAGGLAKGATFDELVTGAAARLRGAVLIGRDRALIAEALARHAPEIPVVEVTGTDTGPMQVAAVMDDVVRAAAALARPGDTVLLAPACASMDMFRDYAERGDAFADAVRRLPGVRPTP
ncbi:MAG: UDP-N-acetylmuramoylalanine--D-glutamate ligase [Actinomycetota bacterium]|nr:UDP-N-acetylmuramoylalanine--D-glutamate ligase [Actinomycetota bacterium]